MIKNSETDSWNALIALYNNRQKEITRYRDYEWKIMIWSIIGLIGITGISGLFISINNEHDLVIIMKTLFVIVSLFMTISTFIYMIFIHNQFIWNRNILRKIDEIFGFFENDIFLKGSVLPTDWKGKILKFADGKRHLIISWTLIILCCVYAIIYIICL